MDRANISSATSTMDEYKHSDPATAENDHENRLCITVRDGSEKSQIPKEVSFSEDDEFYMAPALCSLFHYRHAAIICSTVEVIIITVSLIIFMKLNLENASTKFWFTATLITFLIFACITTSLLIYGLLLERSNFLWPRIAFMQIEVVFLLLCAALWIISMSFGVKTTHSLFSAVIDIHEMETRLGPVWPFNMAVLSFFGAAIVIWFQIIIKGAHDFLLDKEFFTKAANMQMLSTNSK